MGKYEVKTESQLKGDVVKPANKSKSIISKIVDVLLVALLVVSIAFSGTVIFLKIRYNACFVSGMSMYPTLNRDAVNPSGDLISPYHAVGFEDGSKVDYCLSDETDGFKNRINRFDIVCSYYPADYSKGVLKENASQKIKRVVGFPGETVWIVTSNEEGSKYSGSLYVSKDSSIPDNLLNLGPIDLISKGYQIEKVDQPISDSMYDDAVRYSQKDDKAQYNYGKSVDYKNYPNWYWKLDPISETSEGEYVLLGDNRMSSNSSDSRYVGKIQGSYLGGKVVACIGNGTITNREESCNFNYFSFRWRNL